MNHEIIAKMMEDPANWRNEIGRKISFDNSFEQIWQLEGYRKMSQ